MSLVNDALKRARAEERERQTARGSLPYPAPPLDLSNDRSGVQRLAILALLGVVFLVGVLAGAITFVRNRAAATPSVFAADTGTANEPAPGSSSAAVSSLGERHAPTGGRADGGQPSTPPATPSQTALKAASEASPKAPSKAPPGTRSSAPSTRRGAVPPPRETTPPQATESGASDVARRTEAKPTPEPRPAPRRQAPASRTAAATPATASDRPAGEPQPQPREAEPRPARPAAPTASAAATDSAAPADIVRRAETAAGTVLALGGIAWSDTGPFALVNGKVLGAGEQIDGFRVAEIQREWIRLESGSETIVLRLR